MDLPTTDKLPTMLPSCRRYRHTVSAYIDRRVGVSVRQRVVETMMPDAITLTVSALQTADDFGKTT